MKLEYDKDYLLLIDKGAEIKPNNKVWWEDPENGLTSQLNTAIEVHEDLIFMSELNASEIEAFPHEVSLVIAYYPLTKEAKKLDLPELPNPFDVDTYEMFKRINGTCNKGQYEHWLFDQGYKEAQAKYQFNLENMNKAIEMAQEVDSDSISPLYTKEEIIKSLSTQQLPKEFFLGEGETIEKQIKNGYYVY